MIKYINIPQIVNINKLAKTNINIGVLSLDDHNVLLSNVLSTTIGLPKGEFKRALIVP